MRPRDDGVVLCTAGEGKFRIAGHRERAYPRRDEEVGEVVMAILWAGLDILKFLAFALKK